MANTWENEAILGAQLKTTLKEVAKEIKKKLDIDDVITVDGTATFDATNHRLIFNNIIFDSIYPVVGKYGIAVFSETSEATGSADATEAAGDKEWLLDWRPYLVDMSPVVGETAKTPVATLKKDNWLRKTDGTYATVCGITAAQSTALDSKADTLYWKTGSAGSKVSTTCPGAFDQQGKFQSEYFWNWIKDHMSDVNTAAGVTYNWPIEVKLYIGSQEYRYGAYTQYHIPAPWETTETKYSVFIGRQSDVYVVDGNSDTTGEYMRGLAAKPVPVGSAGWDHLEDFKLRRTGISPGPSTVISAKIRNFFYNYAPNTTTANGTITGNAGAASTSIMYNNGHYPVTNGANQYRCADWSRGCNSGGSSGSAVPVGEMGYHALNAFLCSVEAAYGTRNLWNSDRFSCGISSNFSASATNGGVLLDGTTWKMWNASESILQSSAKTYTESINGQYAKFQCMEPQIAASIASEMGVSASETFNWNGGDWHFEAPTGLSVELIGQGSMNGRMYKLTDVKTVNSHTVRCNLVCALVEGVNPVGDIWWYCGGGAELVYNSTGASQTSFNTFFYLEPDQRKWLNTSTSEGPTTDGSLFPAETAYMKLIDNSSVGGTGNTWTISRTGYTPIRRASGGSIVTGECCYQYRQIGEYTPSGANSRTRRRLLFRGNARYNYCGARSLHAYYRPSYTYVTDGCAAQVLLA